MSFEPLLTRIDVQKLSSAPTVIIFGVHLWVKPPTIQQLSTSEVHPSAIGPSVIPQAVLTVPIAVGCGTPLAGIPGSQSHVHQEVKPNLAYYCSRSADKDMIVGQPIVGRLRQ